MFTINVSDVINTYVLGYEAYEDVIKRCMLKATNDQETTINEYLCCLEVFEYTLESYRKDTRRNISSKDVSYLNSKLHDFMACAYEYSLCYELTDKQRTTILKVSLKVSERLTAAIELFCEWGLRSD